MTKRLWLLFSQVVTILIAVFFVVSTLKPSWLSGNPFNHLISSVSVKEAGNSLALAPGSYHDAVRLSMPAVVNVLSTKNANPLAKPGKPNNPHKQGKPKDPEELFNFFFGDPNNQPDNQPEGSTGSGVLISKEGLILTNHHVIEGADKIEVAFGDGRTTTAKVIGSDPDTDIAVLKIDLPHLPEPIVLANFDSVHVGDVVLAIGNPFGVGQTVTSGIVSALGRDHLGINTFENFIQTDAAINPGNSGGALIDTQGHLIGINTAIYSKSGGSMGIGFAIPVNLAKQIMESIVANGKVTRGWVGVEPVDLTPEVVKNFKVPEGSTGVLIGGVLKGGPAETGGVKPGDVLKGVNDKPIKDVRELLNAVASLVPGSQAKLLIQRSGAEQIINVQIGTRPSQQVINK